MALSAFQVKVARHKTGFYFCGRLWKGRAADVPKGGGATTDVAFDD
jgi:hypothetical protein